jgi:hypothetical protein
MNPLEHRIVDILEAVTDRHATAFNVFNVLNRDGYSVTKLEFEKACQQLHDDASVSYRPIRSPLVDIPIGALDLPIRSPSRSSYTDDPSLPVSPEKPTEASMQKPQSPGSLFRIPVTIICRLSSLPFITGWLARHAARTEKLVAG